MNPATMKQLAEWLCSDGCNYAEEYQEFMLSPETDDNGHCADRRDYLLYWGKSIYVDEQTENDPVKHEPILIGTSDSELTTCEERLAKREQVEALVEYFWIKVQRYTSGFCDAYPTCNVESYFNTHGNTSYEAQEACILKCAEVACED